MERRIDKGLVSQLLSSNITPKINNIEISVLPQEGGNVFILHVPKGITAHQNKINHVGKRDTDRLCKIWIEPEVTLAVQGDLTNTQVKEVMQIVCEKGIS